MAEVSHLSRIARHLSRIAPTTTVLKKIDLHETDEQPAAHTLADLSVGLQLRFVSPIAVRLPCRAQSTGWKKFMTTNRPTFRPNLEPSFCE